MSVFFGIAGNRTRNTREGERVEVEGKGGFRFDGGASDGLTRGATWASLDPLGA